MLSETARLPTPDGVALHVTTWLPDDAATVRGIVTVSHGLAEHAARYARFAEALVGEGFAVFAQDHRGHGHTTPEDRHGFYGEPDGWGLVVQDVARVREHARQRFPGVPLVAFGHSMGSLVTLDDVGRNPGDVDLCVLSAPAGLAPLPLVQAGRFVAWLEVLRGGKLCRSAILDFMSAKSWNAQFKPTRTPSDWLSRDPSEVDRYVADPWCGYVCTAQLWRDLLAAQVRCTGSEWIQQVPRGLPILVFAGDRDPVGGNGKQVTALVERMRRIGLDVELKLWPEARHETLNETNRAEVTAHALAWIRRRWPA